MQCSYDSPLGKLTIDVTLTGVCALRFPTTDVSKLERAKRVSQYVLECERHFGIGLSDLEPCMDKTRKWLDLYFAGKKPDFMPDTVLLGTNFQKNVWKLLQEIPYGQSISYGELADKYQEHYHVDKMSSQAIGQAVGANQIPILIPCHRVLGSKNKLTGFADGVEKKAYLLGIEQIPWRP